ncbi:MAG: hypothetical protein M3342_23160 [Bacteroidota bacterium]|nr:hypothetical protein [Flavisolibacter sp.]MDQ3846886.1 hypothetical protein [Bacteroidota bacterium]MBD0288379.1 hypothetical protein [Flavisolibacter sp.]MBD0296025.1 hypothetical protein [Flavisolibacter sp.]MBD0352456.1 hypothetical protein [Flavisolibacter sp.]
MINLKRLFRRNKYILHVDNEEAELLQFFMNNKKDFELWLAENNHQFPRIKFIFYYPTTIEFFFDELRLFTASFNKDLTEAVVFTQLTASKLNINNIRSHDWKPFKEMILYFVSVMEQRNTNLMLKTQKSLTEYQALCRGEEKQKETSEDTRFRDSLSPNVMLPGSTI